MMTEPLACFAIRPVSRLYVRPPTSMLTIFCIFFFFLFSWAAGPQRNKGEPTWARRAAATIRTRAGRHASVRYCPHLRASTTEIELLDQRLVVIGVLVLQVVEEASTLADHLEQATPRMVVVLVQLKVLRESANAFGEKRDLH